MYLIAHVLVVDLARPPHSLVRERWHLGGCHVVLHLRRVLAAGDSAGDGGVHEDPTQRELREGVPPGDESLQLLRGLEACLEVDAGEGLPAIEGLALAVEGAVVVFGERALRAHLAREEAARQRYAGQDAYVAFFR